MSNRDGRDELAARRSARIIEQARLAMVAAGEPAARAARAASNVRKARRKLERGARELLAEGYARRAPGTCAATRRSGAPCTSKAVEGGLCAEHLAAAERKAAKEARRSDAESGRKPEPAKTPAKPAAARQRPQDRPFEGQCTGLNSKGKPCRLPALPGGDRCQHHPRA